MFSRRFALATALASTPPLNMMEGRQVGEVPGSGGWPGKETTSGRELKPSIEIKQEALRSNFIKLPENEIGAKSS